MKNATNRKETATKVMAGIDLHSNNAMIGLVDMQGNRLQHKKVACELEAVLEVLAPYKRRLEKVAVESTYNWYWLVDGLSDHQYPVVLANPARIDQYDGLKHADDKSDAFFLAELLRLGILPMGYIYALLCSRPSADDEAPTPTGNGSLGFCGRGFGDGQPGRPSIAPPHLCEARLNRLNGARCIASGVGSVAGSRPAQAENLRGVRRADGDVIDGAVGGDRIGDESPAAEDRGAEVGSAIYPVARVVGRPLEQGFCGRGFSDGQRGRHEADCVS
jgi:hypothetical protein